MTDDRPGNSLDPNAPIGVFDSGLGGLTVVRAVREALPAERLVYLGDTARVPYGTRSAHTVIRYARTCGRHLQAQGIKALVVACNTVSAVALPMLRVELDVPVLGVVEPGAEAAVAATRSGRVGVIATRGTIQSGAYVRAVAARSSRVEVFGEAAPLLVPLAEEGWLDGPVVEEVVASYLEPLAQHDVDALVLGCTHYPLLRNAIERVARARVPGMVVADGAEASARALKELLERRGLCRTESGAGALGLQVTDLPDRFAEVGARFLGMELDGFPIEVVDLPIAPSS